MAHPTRARRHKGTRIVRARSRPHPETQRATDEAATAIQENWSPKIEAVVRDDHLIVRIDVPGFAAEDVEIEIIDDVLAIRGERKESHTERVSGYYSDESSYILFSRKIQLPQGTDAGDAIATLYEGVLQVTMHFSPSSADEMDADDAASEGSRVAGRGRNLLDEARRAFVGRIYRPLLVSVH